MTSLRRLVCPFNAFPSPVTVFLWNCGRDTQKPSRLRRAREGIRKSARGYGADSAFFRCAAVPSHTHHAAVCLWPVPRL